MSDDQFANRKRLSFAQAEGVEPLPRQLVLKEVSTELRAKLWFLVHESMLECREYPSTGGRPYLRDPWKSIMYAKHVFLDHKMADEFENRFDDLSSRVKAIFASGNYVEIFGFLQWLLRQSDRSLPAKYVEQALKTSRAAYRVLDDGKTIVPIGSEEERKTLERAFADVAAQEFHGARSHLRKAAEHLTSGQNADSIRESIHAVESVARTLEPSGSLSDALRLLEAGVGVHPALKRGFLALYGFTSDEKGIRHPLLEEGSAKVDETDALFMIGACAAFVSYLVSRARPRPGK